MKDYSAMSDFEVNKAVDDILYPPIPRHSKAYNRNYCNNPADAWPIITENSIVIMPYMRGEKPALWLCFDVNNSDLDCQDENPLRAAMIVYLQMMEQKS